MLGELIRNYLDENGIKYAFVAEAVNLPASVFSAILKGKRRLVAEEYFKICFVLDVDTNYFATKLKKKSA